MKNISILGLGYIGLPTGILAAQSGLNVYGYDIDKNKLKQISKGNSTIVEPEITSRLYEVLKNKKFQVIDELKDSDCFVIAVPTPFKKNKKNNLADLSFVYDAAFKIAKVLAPGNLIILESTVPVGTTEKIANFLEKKSGLKLGIDFFVAHCPERVLPGKIFEELIKNDRVIGAACDKSAELAKNFYSKFVSGKLYFTDDKTAEMVKLVENSYRDVSIAFANQIADLAQCTKINPFNVISLANKHPRVNILNPGCGVGGHCIAVDPWFLIEAFPKKTNLLKVARKINDEKPEKIIKQTLLQIKIFHEEKKRKPNCLILGLTFKPNVDDMRESPALKIAKKLNRKKIILNLSVCEPNIATEKIKSLGFEPVVEILDGIKSADIILVLVKHKEFYLLQKLDLNKKNVIDTCGLLNNHLRAKSNLHLNFKEYLDTKVEFNT
ncbi:nucleotide sugar dehydrogenase [Candidatus Dependentiae bacterium]|nr:nucleotide sugar dehydrogenase [Candidatus Dependentiae bacterium]